jgi:hypothetical protein
MEERSRS